MKNWIITLVVVGFLAIFGYSSHLFINKTLTDLHVISAASGELKCVEKNFEEFQKAIEASKKTDIEMERLSTDDVTNLLADRGWMRPPDDK